MSFNSGMKGADVVALLKNGLPIVDDVNKLDPNAELGSMASVVTPGSMQETSVRNLYQPDASIVDPDAGILTAPELLSSVSSIKVFAPTDAENIGLEPVDSTFYLVPRDFSMTNQTVATVSLYDGEIYALVNGHDATQEFVLVEYSSDTDSFIVHDDQVEAFNAALANGMDWCYFGCPDTGFVITEEQFNTIDLFINTVDGVPSNADIYVKKDTWEKFYKSEWDNLDKIKADKIAISAYNGCVNPNIYTTYTVNTTGDVFVALKGGRNFSTYKEYIIELKCLTTPRILVFEDPDISSGIPSIKIKWNNGVAPTFKAGFTYIISIVNGFGVYSTFINE